MSIKGSSGDINRSDTPVADSPTPLMNRMYTAMQYFKAAIKARDETQGEGKVATQAAAPPTPAK